MNFVSRDFWNHLLNIPVEILLLKLIAKKLIFLIYLTFQTRSTEETAKWPFFFSSFFLRVMLMYTWGGKYSTSKQAAWKIWITSQINDDCIWTQRRKYTLYTQLKFGSYRHFSSSIMRLSCWFWFSSYHISKIYIYEVSGLLQNDIDNNFKLGQAVKNDTF